MIPLYSRVAAIDDNEDHLQKIVWGLGKARFSAIPFLFEDGRLENPPDKPIRGVRLVFTDIHMIGGGQGQTKIHAANIINCLKKIVCDGPYVLIFWSQYPDEGTSIFNRILETAAETGLTPPIGHAAIDKNLIFKVSSSGGEDEEFNAEKLRDLILEKIQSFKTLAVSLSWEDRVVCSAARTTDNLFDLVGAAEDRSGDWDKLLAFLASEAVGQNEAGADLIAALDSALLPLLEDQLSQIGDDDALDHSDAQGLRDLVLVENGPSRPISVSASRLNTSYLVEELRRDSGAKMWTRGTVTELGSGFINSGPFIQAFGQDDAQLIRQEFSVKDLTAEEKRQIKLHVIELGPECDHVQEKVSTHRYLLAVFVPSALLSSFVMQGKKGSLPRYRNDSVMDVGKLSLGGSPPQDCHLLVSGRCFMALAARTSIDGVPKFRLRRALLEEVAHKYVTHARRPGVMRFYEKS